MMDILMCLVWMLMIWDKGVAAERRNRNKQSNDRVGVDDIMKGLLRNSYAKADPPRFDAATKVSLGIYVNSFYSISEQTMEYAISFYLRQSWKDERLAFKIVHIPHLGNVSKLTLSAAKTWEKIWLPDIFFRNEKSAHIHGVTVPNRMLTLDHEGNLWYVSKISATLSCPMKLHRYPLDTQYCPMMFESFGYTMDTMYFDWLPSPVDIDPSVQLPQFTLKDKILYDCSQNYTAGAFPCLEIQFVLHRQLGFFLIQIYVPTSLIVILSWVSFWINVDAIPARVSLGLVTVLTMTTQSAGANQALPRVSYVKAIDVWFSMCLVFVFMSLLEFAVVNVISRKQPKPKPKKEKPPRSLPTQYRDMERSSPLDQPKPKSFTLCGCMTINILENGRERRDGGSPTKVLDGKAKARRIDKISRKVFPITFMLFNIVYWVCYTLPEADPVSLGSA